jgi:hypothetical protein
MPHSPSRTAGLDPNRPPMRSPISAAEHGLREAIRPLIRAVYDEDGQVSVAAETLGSDDLLQLQKAALDADPRTPLRRAVQPFLDSLVSRDGRAGLDLPALTNRDWLILKRTDARADALIATPQARQDAADQRLDDAARPFAGAVYNDNGDVTLSTSHVREADWATLRDAIPEASVTHPLRRIARRFAACLSESDGTIDRERLGDGDWVAIRKNLIYR